MWNITLHNSIIEMHKYKETFTAKTHPSQFHLYMNNPIYKKMINFQNCSKIYALGSIPLDLQTQIGKVISCTFYTS